jgi:hypothetical protein
MRRAVVFLDLVILGFKRHNRDKPMIPNQLFFDSSSIDGRGDNRYLSLMLDKSLQGLPQLCQQYRKQDSAGVQLRSNLTPESLSFGS